MLCRNLRVVSTKDHRRWYWGTDRLRLIVCSQRRPPKGDRVWMNVDGRWQNVRVWVSVGWGYCNDHVWVDIGGCWRNDTIRVYTWSGGTGVVSCKYSSIVTRRWRSYYRLHLRWWSGDDHTRMCVYGVTQRCCGGHVCTSKTEGTGLLRVNCCVVYPQNKGRLFFVQ